MSFKIVNTINIAGIDFGEKLLESLDATLIKGSWSTEDELIANTAGADAVIGAPGQAWTHRVFKTLSQCRIIACSAIGYDRVDLDGATECGIAVTNVPDYCIDEVSNQAIAFLMTLGRKLFPIDRVVRETSVHLTPGNRQGLADYAHPIFRLRDQTLGIVGFGKIGTAVGLKAKGLGMRVIAYDPYVFGAIMRTHGVEPVDFNTLLRESDFISINAFLNEETRGMIGYEEFKKMKSTCYLINTARGKIVDQPALIRALQEDLIAGAGLDVTAEEPIPKDDPILNQPNVILTGHSAWYSVTSDSGPEYWHRAMGQVVMALNGEWPVYAVNPEVKQKWLENWGKKV